jgi:hypothetical protein
VRLHRGNGRETPHPPASAKERAQEAAETAKEQGADVASTVADEAKHLAEEATTKASDLLSDVKAQVDEQSRTQLKGLASRIGELGDELDGLIRGGGATDGAVTDLARQLSDRTRALSNHLSDREPSDLVADVRTFARRKPGTFLLGAAAAGLVAGRLTRGAKHVKDTATPASTTTTTSPEVPLSQSSGGAQ